MYIRRRNLKAIAENNASLTLLVETIPIFRTLVV